MALTIPRSSPRVDGRTPFTARELPPFVDMRIESLTTNREQRLMIIGAWTTSAGTYRAEVAIDVRNGKGTVHGSYRFGDIVAKGDAALSRADLDLLVQRAWLLSCVDGVAATPEARAALALARATCRGLKSS